MTVFINSQGFLINLVTEPDCKNVVTVLADSQGALNPLMHQSLGDIFVTNDHIWTFGIHIPGDRILPSPFEHVHLLRSEPIETPLHPTALAWAWEGLVTLDAFGEDIEPYSEYGYLWSEELHLVEEIASSSGIDYLSLYPVFELPFELMDKSARQAHFQQILDPLPSDEEDKGFGSEGS